MTAPFPHHRPVARRRRLGLVLVAAAMLTAGAVVPASAGPTAAPQALPTGCAGTSPITCHYAVAPRNHTPTFATPSSTSAANTEMWVEARRLMLPGVATAAGTVKQYSFTVNVRQPEGQPTGQGGTGTPGLDIRFAGSNPKIAAVTVTPAAAPLVTYLAGDSTVCDQPSAPYTGWGQILPSAVGPGAAIANYADSGESSGSFRANKALFPTLLGLVKRNDLVFIQFGHNDKTTTAQTFRDNITAMVSQVRTKGGVPVLVTPPVRRSFTGTKLNSTGLIVNGLGVDLPAQMRAVAVAQHTPLIDLTAKSKALVESLGPADSARLYLRASVDGVTDNTHFSQYGATQMAGLVEQGVREQNLSLAPYLLGNDGGGTTYTKLRNLNSGLAVDGEGRTTAGAIAGQSNDSGSTSQQWILQTEGSYVRIRNHATGLYLDGLGATTNGAAAGQWSDTNSTNQQWSMETTGGIARFKNRATGLFLDGMGRTSNGNDLGQYSGSTSSNQQWTIVTASPVASGTADTNSAASATTYYVAPNGSDGAAGTKTAPWASIAHAQSVVQPGDTVYVRGGTYAYSRANSNCGSQTAQVDAITLNKSGSSSGPINYFAYPGEKPVFDFSRMTDNCRIKGFDVTGSWIHLKGLEVTGVRQNNNKNHESWGIWISGSHNIFEQLDLHNNMGPGLFIQNGSANLVLNSDSHDNYDPLSSTGPGTNADGFGAHISAGNPGNVFRGDRAWWNADDGFDLINAFSSVTIENCWAWRSGYRPETTTSAGDGNGFKVGGYGGKYVSNAVKHTLRNSVAFLNKAAGVYANHHPLANDYFNNTSYGNHPDFNMLGITSSGGAVGRGNLRNNLAYTGILTSNMSGTSAANNSWNLSIGLSDSQFHSVSTSGWNAPRQADGSLPSLPYLHLAANSTLIDKGVNVGLPYNGSAPDLGAFETASGITAGQ